MLAVILRPIFTLIAAVQFTCCAAVAVHGFRLMMYDVLATRSVVMMIRRGYDKGM